METERQNGGRMNNVKTKETFQGTGYATEQEEALTNFDQRETSQLQPNVVCEDEKEDEAAGALVRCSSSSEQGSCRGYKEEGASNEEKDEDEKDQQEQKFPQQLMDVIERETVGGEGVVLLANGEKIIEWTPSGNAFVVRDKKRLVKDVLRKYFRAKCTSASFTRKLYRWGFRQVEKTTTGSMIFKHPNFVRGDKQRCLKLRLIINKGTRVVHTSPGFLPGHMRPITTNLGHGIPQAFTDMDQSSMMRSMAMSTQLNQFPQQDTIAHHFIAPNGQGGYGVDINNNKMNSNDNILSNDTSSNTISDTGINGMEGEPSLMLAPNQLQQSNNAEPDRIKGIEAWIMVQSMEHQELQLRLQVMEQRLAELSSKIDNNNNSNVLSDN